MDAAKQLPEHPDSRRRLAAGQVTFDRALATARLAASGAHAAQVAAAAGYDLAGIQRITARQRRITVSAEQDSFRARYLAIQPTLDDASWRFWGQIPAADGAVVQAALTARGDRLHAVAGGTVPSSKGQRYADALVALAQDSLNATSDQDGNQGAGAGVVSIFVDAATAAATSGEAGGEIAAGPRVGPPRWPKCSVSDLCS